MIVKVNILLEVLRKKKYKSDFKEQLAVKDSDSHRTELHDKDVVGFIIFLVVIVVFFIVSSYLRS
jgi:hypothetical protein